VGDDPGVPTATIVLGEHPHTIALRSGEVTPELLDLEWVEVTPTNRAFAPMLREGAYDVSEIAITVFLQAIEAGKPVRLLPVVAVGGFHHGSIYVNPQARGPRRAEDLNGARIAVRAYSQTTGLYVRGFLAEDHGVRAEDVTWVTTEGSHVAEYEDPPNVERTEAKLTDLLRAGEVDAAILGPGQAQEGWCVPLFDDAEARARAWSERHGGLVPINHMVCVGPAVGEDPALVADLHAALRRSFDAAPTPPSAAITFDRERIETGIAYALGLAREQGLVRADLEIPALFAAM
jgi:4,5-dihydroxyphthalate decarboxylase